MKKDFYQFLMLFVDGIKKFLSLTARGKAIVVLVISTIITTCIGINFMMTGGLEWIAHSQGGADYVLPVVYLISWALLLIYGRNNRRVIYYSLWISTFQLLYAAAAVAQHMRLDIGGGVVILSVFISPIAMLYKSLGLLAIIVSVWFAISLILFARSRKENASH